MELIYILTIIFCTIITLAIIGKGMMDTQERFSPSLFGRNKRLVSLVVVVNTNLRHTPRFSFDDFNILTGNLRI